MTDVNFIVAPFGILLSCLEFLPFLSLFFVLWGKSVSSFKHAVPKWDFFSSLLLFCFACFARNTISVSRTKRKKNGSLFNVYYTCWSEKCRKSIRTQERKKQSKCSSASIYIVEIWVPELALRSHEKCEWMSHPQNNCVSKISCFWCSKDAHLQDTQRGLRDVFEASSHYRASSHPRLLVWYMCAINIFNPVYMYVNKSLTQNKLSATLISRFLFPSYGHSMYFVRVKQVVLSCGYRAVFFFVVFNWTPAAAQWIYFSESSREKTRHTSCEKLVGGERVCTGKVQCSVFTAQENRKTRNFSIYEWISIFTYDERDLYTQPSRLDKTRIS